MREAERICREDTETVERHRAAECGLHSTATIGRVTCVFNLRSFVIAATDIPPSGVSTSRRSEL